MTRREKRVVDAFINCIKHGEYTEEYAITLIEDNARYGWMSETAKDAFYEALDALHPTPVEVIYTQNDIESGGETSEDTSETEDELVDPDSTSVN